MAALIGYIILAAVGAGLIGVVFRPQWALVLVITMYTLKQIIGGYLPIFKEVSPLFNFVVFAAVLLAVVARLLRKDRPLSGMFNPLTVVTFSLYAYALLSVLWSPGNAWPRVIDGYPYWIMNAMLLPLVLVTVEDLRRTLIPLVLVGTATVLLFYVNPDAGWFQGRYTIYIGGSGETQVRGNPLATGLMGGQLVVAAALMLPIRQQALTNIARVLAIVVGLGLAVVSGSRGQALLAVLTVVLFYPMSRQVKSVKQFFLKSAAMAMLAAMIAAVLDVFLGVAGTQSTRWDVSTQVMTLLQRMDEATRLFDVYASNPQWWLQGMGTNSYSAYWNNAGLVYPHNAVVEMICDLGVVGFMLYCTGIVLAFRAAWGLFRAYANEPVARASIAVLLALCFYTFALSMKEGTFVGTADPWWLWILMAKLAAHDRHLRKAAAARWHESDYVEYEPQGADAETVGEAVS